MSDLLSATTVVAYLRSRGLLGDGDVTVEELGGGVSNVVLAVRGGGVACVVKQALPELAVDDHWPAKPQRAITEADAVELCRRLVKGSAPAVLDVDHDRCALVIELAPDGWRSWKTDLLEGRADPEVARVLGATLRTWHDGTSEDAVVHERFDDAEAFEQLRVDPYYRTTMLRVPEAAGLMAPYVERMASTKRCLVHGDYSPKNVLVSPSGDVWVLDFEVAHLGDPAFDLAFMLNHLCLKAIHVPEAAGGMRACARTFLDAYGDVDDPTYVFGHVGCLMLARVDGKSPAEYLTDDGRTRARRSALAILRGAPSSLDDVWGLVA